MSEGALEPIALEGVVVDPLRLGRGVATPVNSLERQGKPQPLARIAIGGPADGKVMASASTRLDYRKPSLTVVSDFDSGRVESAEVSADVLYTYVPKLVMVLGVRQYRIWVGEKEWDELQTVVVRSGSTPMAEFEAEVILRLIDGDPREIRACRQLP